MAESGLLACIFVLMLMSSQPALIANSNGTFFVRALFGKFAQRSCTPEPKATKQREQLGAAQLLLSSLTGLQIKRLRAKERDGVKIVAAAWPREREREQESNSLCAARKMKREIGAQAGRMREPLIIAAIGRRRGALQVCPVT